MLTTSQHIETRRSSDLTILDFLPAHAQTHCLHRTAHIAGHLQFLAGGAGNVDDIAAHRDEAILRSDHPRLPASPCADPLPPSHGAYSGPSPVPRRWGWEC